MAFVHPNHKTVPSSVNLSSHLQSTFQNLQLIENLQRSCLLHSPDSFCLSNKTWVVWWDCTGEGRRTNWASPGAHHTWGLPSPGLSTLLCHCNNFPTYGSREKGEPLPLCRDWIRQNDEENGLTQDPNIWVMGTLQWMGNEGLFFHSRNSHTVWVIEMLGGVGS